MNKVIVALCLGLASALDAGAIEVQQQPNWCWAATVQAVAAQAGYYEPQAVVASRLTGVPVNRPATIPEVVSLVRSYGLVAWEAGYPGSPQELYQSLLNGWKLIAFVRPQDGPVGHYILLEGIDPFGNVVVSDPWTGETRTNTLQQLYYGWRWSDSIVVGRR